jgi:hypothetical protein
MATIYIEIRKRVVSLTKFCIDALRLFRKDKSVFIAEGEAIRRRAICGACEHFRAGMCDVCGCVMSVKVKFSAAKCPLEDKRKW